MDSDHGIPGEPSTEKAPNEAPGQPPHADAWSTTGWPAGWSVRHVAETGSTNTDLLAAADRGEAGDRTVLAADHQTAGRGRLDRRWEAPPGVNLLTSLLFAAVPDTTYPFMTVVSLAAVDAIETLAGTTMPERLGLKWPNDLLLDDRKLAGMLAQRSSVNGSTVVGIGINVSWSPETGGCIARDLGLDIRPADLLRSMLGHVDEMLRHPDGRQHVAARYRQRLLTLGETVRMELPGDRTVSGTAVDVDDDGRLLLDVDGSIETFDVGDVIHARRT
ncbi:biotin--[acetyl-CoA-carboxylase] ligase [Ilumatobacter coccineus]|uniref:biotin--[biotin carboxyl-carrier protein] ligase n=1 Tax=Ilumatobacter coccineus (strain NBRC 103263 / KCTC 29153 / YM16-304) TaxID=1313172 RepID=A0A6C7EDD1_ILUCY|nr:biotin--[acetyl-CoA-carboxylase] ligase [Ilumatobacter coccineus]BAN03189.1 biotin--[acetyl-CoA-carboxylase] synthetase [Ilumatobacter coccineus YM16-304]